MLLKYLLYNYSNMCHNSTMPESRFRMSEIVLGLELTFKFNRLGLSRHFFWPSPSVNSDMHLTRSKPFILLNSYSMKDRRIGLTNHVNILLLVP